MHDALPYISYRTVDTMLNTLYIFSTLYGSTVYYHAYITIGGAYHLAMKNPQLFHALVVIAPASPTGPPYSVYAIEGLERIKHIPVFILQGNNVKYVVDLTMVNVL